MTMLHCPLSELSVCVSYRRPLLLSAFLSFLWTPDLLTHYTCEQVARIQLESSTDKSWPLETIDVDALPVLYPTQPLGPAESGPNRQFGHIASLDGATLAISRRDGADEFRGSVELFELESTGWNNIATLRSSALQEGEQFNVASVSGDTLLVGAWGYCGSPPDIYCQSGAAYIYQRDYGGDDNWGLVRQLNAGDVFESRFGLVTALDGDTAVVAAPHETVNHVLSVGAVYVFERNSGGQDQWGMVKRLESDSAVKTEGDFFGSEVFISQDTILSLGADSSVIYEFGRNTGGENNWGFVQKLALPGGQGRAAYDGDVLFLRVVDTCLPSDERIDHLWFYGKDDTGAWVPRQEIVPDPDLNLRYIAIDGQQAMISATDSNTGFLLQRGADPDSWAFVARLGTDIDALQNSIPSSAALDAGTATLAWSGYDDSEGRVLVYETAQPINAGHSGAWFNPSTPGQGQLIDVDPESQFIFLSWFTYTDANSANPNEQRWMTAQGHYTGNKAVLPLYETLGGAFDDPKTASTEQIGEVTLSFTDCGLGRVDYRIYGEGLSGSFPIGRVIPGSEAVCAAQSENALQAVDINPGMDGAWYDPASPGQGFLFDVHSDSQGGNFIFVAWFTYGDDTASGQRWLTAQGPFEGSTAEIDVYETLGGAFDNPQPTETTPVGTMTIDFSDCSNARLNYALADGGVAGSIDITRLLAGGKALCEELAGTQ